jgi:predicted metal-dependent HD superfamily phosphohydrolase
MSRARFYHHLGHIADCLEVAVRFSQVVPLAGAEMDAAIIAHDCVYHTHAGVNNEEASAAVAEMLLREAGVGAPAIDTVVRLILATKHEGVPGNDAEAFIRDVDLVSLAASPAEFDANTAAIRAEFQAVGEDEWRAGRVKFFRSMLERDSIFFTPAFKERFEAFARANLARGLRTLAEQP